MIIDPATIAHLVGIELNLAGRTGVDQSLCSAIAESAIELKEKFIIPIAYETNKVIKVSRVMNGVKGRTCKCLYCSMNEFEISRNTLR